MAGSTDRHDSLERPFCDAVIISHGVQFYIHKVTLGECSTYFRALFLRHSAPDRNRFEVPDLSAAIMELIIRFAHTGSVSVTEDNVQELLQAADQFIITGIEQACCNFLLERLSSENCINIWQLCNICFCSELQQKAYRYLLIHFEEVVSREEFQQLSLQELSCILDSDELNVRWEMILCKAIFKWVDYEPAERQQHMAVLLSKVRLALTCKCFLTELMNTEAVSSNAECMEIVQQAQKLKTYMSMLTPSLSICSNQAARPRLPNDILFVIGGQLDGNQTTVTEVYDFHTDRWNAVSDHGARPHVAHGIVYCNGFVYCVGGTSISGPMNALHRLDLTTHTWLDLAPMLLRRCFLSVTVLDGFIYAIGGNSNSPFDVRISATSSAERYDPQTNRWSSIAPMHEQRQSASCISLNNMIYICGGQNGGRHRNSYLNTCECYCPETNQWTMFKSMNRQRCGHGVIAYKDLIFAVGGCYLNRDLNKVEAYNPQTNSWEAVPHMLRRRSFFGIAVIDNKLFAVGGSIGNDSSVEFYDRSTNLWSEACQIEFPRFSLSCCVVSGLPNVAEYVISRDKLGRLDEEEGLVES